MEAVDEVVDNVRVRVALAVDGRGRAPRTGSVVGVTGVFGAVDGAKLDLGVGVVVFRFAMDTDRVRNDFSWGVAVEPVLARGVGFGVSVGFVAGVARTLAMEALFVMPTLGVDFGVITEASFERPLFTLRRLASEPDREWVLSRFSRDGGWPLALAGVPDPLVVLVTEAVRECVDPIDDLATRAAAGDGRVVELAIEEAREGRMAVAGLTAEFEVVLTFEDLLECVVGVAAALAADDAVDALATEDVRECVTGRAPAARGVLPVGAALGVDTVRERATGRVDETAGRLVVVAAGDFPNGFVGDLPPGVNRVVDLADDALAAGLLETAARVAGGFAVGAFAGGVDRTEFIDGWCRNVDGPARGEGASSAPLLLSFETGRFPVSSGRGGPLITVGVGLPGLPSEGEMRLRDPTETTRVLEAAVGLRGVGPEDVGVCLLDCEAAAALEAAREDVTEALDAELESRSLRRPLRSDGSGVSTPRRVDTDARFACPCSWLGWLAGLLDETSEAWSTDDLECRSARDVARDAPPETSDSASPAAVDAVRGKPALERGKVTPSKSSIPRSSSSLISFNDHGSRPTNPAASLMPIHRLRM